MKQLQKSSVLFAALMGTASLAGCGGGNGGASGGPVSPPQNATVNLQTYADPWTRATPRARDIANTLFADSFAQTFDYARSNVALSYDRAPTRPYFTGHLKASGLKPNFAYQLKLAGRPIYGSRGAGTANSTIEADRLTPGAKPLKRVVKDANGNATPIVGDDWSNQQLGYAGRWWDDTDPPSTNLNDAYFRANYPSHTIYGYIFIGDFVTDSAGNADLDIAAAHSYHITGRDRRLLWSVVAQTGSLQDMPVVIRAFDLIEPSSPAPDVAAIEACLSALSGSPAPTGSRREKLEFWTQWWQQNAARIIEDAAAEGDAAEVLMKSPLTSWNVRLRSPVVDGGVLQLDAPTAPSR